VSPTAQRALVVAPHPDDETLGCGGMMAEKRLLGGQVSVVFLTDGREGGARAPEDKDPGRSRRQAEALVELRQEEAIRAAAVLGLGQKDLYFMKGHDGRLAEELACPTQGMAREVAELVEQVGAEEVYVPHYRDSHPDHEAAYKLTVAALKLLKPPVHLRQYPIWLWWSALRRPRLRGKDMSGALVMPLGEGWRLKRRALECYESQLSRFPKGFVDSLVRETEIYFATP